MRTKMKQVPGCEHPSATIARMEERVKLDDKDSLRRVGVTGVALATGEPWDVVRRERHAIK